MTTLRVRPQKVPYHARQVARFIAIALSMAGMLDGRAEQDEALSASGLPQLDVKTPDGKRFRITVEEVQ